MWTAQARCSSDTKPIAFDREGAFMRPNEPLANGSRIWLLLGDRALETFTVTAADEKQLPAWGGALGACIAMCQQGDELARGLAYGGLGASRCSARWFYGSRSWEADGVSSSRNTTSAMKQIAPISRISDALTTSRTKRNGGASFCGSQPR